jgi:hypothetical protein
MANPACAFHAEKAGSEGREEWKVFRKMGSILGLIPMPVRPALVIAVAENQGRCGSIMWR